jgi:hypothetical protein
MLRWISIFGGLLIMMGHHARSEALFYYFRLEDQVPENHLLSLIDRPVRFAFVLERLRDSYSETGRPSIDPSYCCAFCCWVTCTASSSAIAGERGECHSGSQIPSLASCRKKLKPHAAHPR